MNAQLTITTPYVTNQVSTIMNNIFEKSVTDTLISRVNQLTPTTANHWGQMNVAQMLAHCNVTYEMTYENKRSEEHTSELQSQSTISYAVFCLKKKKKKIKKKLKKKNNRKRH